jgi:hypothetical protein
MEITSNDLMAIIAEQKVENYMLKKACNEMQQQLMILQKEKEVKPSKADKE